MISWWRSVAVRLLTKSHSHIKRCKAAVGWWYSRRMCYVDISDFAGAQRQSYESQESCENSAELAYDHRTTKATSEDFRRNTAWWLSVYRTYCEIKYPSGRLFNQFLHRWQTYQSNCDLYYEGRGCLFKKRKISMQLPYGLRMAEITLDRQVHQGY